MSWREVTTVALRLEFVKFSQQEGCNFSELCKRFSVSRKTGYKWVKRYLQAGEPGLMDQSRRPHTSPMKTVVAIEDAVIALRVKHPAWGARKLRKVLQDNGQKELPVASTITSILHRRDKIDHEESMKHTPYTRFEHPRPNDLWQMDYKGHFPMQHGRCHPLTVIDDHSRFSIVLDACANEMTETVKQALIKAFRIYGLPYRMTMDNGSPWGSDAINQLTILTVWLIRLGVLVSHSRPYHPQTQGKDERFHRTLNRELISGRSFEDIYKCQQAFDGFRDIYNFVRPHEALGMNTPATRYRPSERAYPESLPPVEYLSGDEVRKVQAEGQFTFKGRMFRVSKALRGHPIALRETADDGIYTVHFCHQRVKLIDLNGDQSEQKSVTYVPEQL